MTPKTKPQYSDTIECAHCGCSGGIMYPRGGMFLCVDCKKDRIPDDCIACEEWSCLEDQPCSWCTRNNEIVMQDRYRKAVIV